MTFRDFRSGNWMGLSILTAAALLLGVVLGKLRSREYRPGPSAYSRVTEVSETTGGTNSNPGPVLARKDGLKLLEEELSRSLKRFAPQSSPESTLDRARTPAPTVRQSVSKRKKSAGDNKDDLIYLTPEDLAKGETLEEVLNLPQYDEQGRKKTEVSAMERYFERLNGRTTPGDQKSQTPNPFDEPEEEETTRRWSDDSNLPAALRNSEVALRRELNRETIFDRMFEPAREPDQARRDDLFGFEQQQTFSTADTRNPYLEQFREMLESPKTPGFAGPDPSKPINPLSSSLGTGMRSDPFASTRAFVPRDSQPTPLGSLRPFSSAEAVADPTQRALNQWDPYYTPPVQQTKPFEMPKPNFQAPRRKF